GVRGADLRAIDGLARPRRHRLHVERAKFFVGLLHRIGVDAGWRADAAIAPAALREAGDAAAAAASLGRRRVVDVVDPLGWAAVVFQLRLDPVDRRAIAIRALPAIAELREPLERC